MIGSSKTKEIENAFLHLGRIRFCALIFDFDEK